VTGVLGEKFTSKEIKILEKGLMKNHPGGRPNFPALFLNQPSTLVKGVTKKR